MSGVVLSGFRVGDEVSLRAGEDAGSLGEVELVSEFASGGPQVRVRWYGARTTWVRAELLEKLS